MPPLKKAVAQLFPVCNSPGEVPSTELNEFAQRSLQNREDDLLPRADFLLCHRALKVIEKYCFSRSRLSVGPLKMALSIAGILESTASWTSVLHSLGLVTSYDSTERFRKRLIAEREESAQGGFQNVNLHDRVVTVQIYNFDIMPFHNVKASGKSLPMVSGTATQSIVQSRKRKRTF